jgi:DHA1 family tetracycline resistance protein-like MFS transporter
MMYAIMIPFALGGLAGPALQGIISNQVGPNEQGTLQGSLTSLISLTSIIGPLLMTNLFSFFTSDSAPFYFPGAPFFAGAFLALAGLLLSVNPLLSMDKIPKH